MPVSAPRPRVESHRHAHRTFLVREAAIGSRCFSSSTRAHAPRRDLARRLVAVTHYTHVLQRSTHGDYTLSTGAALGPLCSNLAETERKMRDDSP